MNLEFERWLGRYAGSGVWRDTTGQSGSYTTELLLSASNGAGLRFDGASLIELPNGNHVSDSAAFQLRKFSTSSGVFQIKSDKLDMEGLGYYLNNALILKYTFTDKDKTESITESYSLDSKGLRHTGLIEQEHRVIFLTDELLIERDGG